MAGITKDIFDQLIDIGGLYEQVFGRLLDGLIYHNGVEGRKNLLKNAFNFRDVEALFPKEIEYENFHEITKIIFKYYEVQTPEQNRLLLNTKTENESY